MVKKIHSKTETTIETDHFEIVACKDSQLQSFLNVFHLEGETHTQSNLGEVFGVIQVHDHSEQSAYLPNLIAQVIKKEFYKNSKRPTEISFEAALHKANSALAELVQHELVQWHGKLDAAIGVVSNGHFFFTQTNKGKIFLLRDKKIAEISKGLDEPTDNPLKTFSDVSSGVVEINDKIIFSTPSIHDSLPFEDLKRHSNTFSSDEFDNLLKSTLDTEGENVGTIVVNFQEKTVAQTPLTSKKKKNDNYFGKNEEERKGEKKDVLDKKPQDEEEEEEKRKSLAKKTEAIINKGKKEEEKEEKKTENERQAKNLSPFEKQPELFIKEGDQEMEDVENEISAVDSLKDKSTEIVEKIKKKLPFSEDAKQASLQDKGVKEEKEKPSKKKKVEKNESKTVTTKKERPKKHVDEELSTEIPPLKNKKEQPLSSGSFFDDEESDTEKKTQNKKSDKVDTKLKNFWKKDSKKSNIYKDGIKNIFMKKDIIYSSAGKLMQRAKKVSKKINLKDQKQEFSEEKGMPLKLISVIIIVLVFLAGVFYFVSVFSNRYDAAKEEKIFDEEEKQKQENDLASVNKNITEVKKVVDLESDIVSMAYDDGSIFMLTALNSFYRYETHNGTLEEISIGEHIKNARTIGTINNLNLILLVSNEKVVNYNRVTKSFDENKVDLPEELDVISVGSYLSYFYIFDKKSGQIYRYSRGNDKPVVWLKDAIDASSSTDMVIDDSIRLVYSDGTIEKYFKNKKEDSFLLDYEPKITPNRITTAIDHNYYYVLDEKQGVIGVVNKETDDVEKTFVNEKIIGSKDLHFDVEENKIYFVSSDAQLMMIEL